MISRGILNPLSLENKIFKDNLVFKIKLDKWEEEFKDFTEE